MQLIIAFAYWFAIGFIGYYIVAIILALVIAMCMHLLDIASESIQQYQTTRSTAKRRLRFEKVICPVTLEII
jgi:hypothetical protein